MLQGVKRGGTISVVLFVVTLLATGPGSGETPEPDGVPVQSPLARDTVTEEAAPLPPPEGAVTLRPAWDPAIPLEALTPEFQHVVNDVVGQAVFSHHVRGITYRSRKEVFRFLIERPEFAAALARILRVGDYQVTRIADGYWADDSRGARGLFRVLRVDETRRLYYFEGSYSGRLLPAVRGRVLIVEETQHHESPDGTSYAETKLTGYLRLDSAITEFLTRITRPIAEAAVDRKVRRFFRTVSRVSQYAHDDPEGFYETLARHPELPEETLASFREALLAQRLPPWAEGKQFRLIPDGSLERLHSSNQ